jgi:cupin superfamily acireductone dioxygenase involved in methionine salvage
MKDFKIYHFKQNNSGGHFIINDELCPNVYITAKTAEDANKKAENIGIYFDGVNEGVDCPCCGDRWYRVDEDDAECEILMSKFEFIWCDYIILYDENMKAKKLFKEDIKCTEDRYLDDLSDEEWGFYIDAYD